MDDMRNKMSGAKRLTKWSKKFLKPCLTAFLLLWVLLEVRSVRGFSLDTGWPLSEYPGYRCLVYFHPCVNDQECNYNAHWLNVTIDTYYYLVVHNPHEYDDMKKYEVLPSHISSIDLHSQLYLFETKGHGWTLIKKQEKPIVSFLLIPFNAPLPTVFPKELVAMRRGYAKPVIYLYPESETEVTVRLDYKGRLTCTYPAPDPDDAWRVTAWPNGTLTDRQGREYSYLFWEGASDGTPSDFSRGFVVKGSDTAAFLREKLAYMGLTPREYNEFIVYWLPRMQGNPWNLIAFQGKNYTDSAPLTVTPRPDSVLRIFMAYRPLAAPIVVPPQELTPFVRNKVYRLP